MSTVDYAPLRPAYNPAFDTAFSAHREILAELLISADALQEITFQALCRSGAGRCELAFDPWVLALGQGDEAAHVAAEMAGYEKSANGRWVSSKSGKITQLRLPPTLISEYLWAWSEAC